MLTFIYNHLQDRKSHRSTFPSGQINETFASAIMTSPALDKAPYTIDTLPYGVISTTSAPEPRCAVAIGDHAIDLGKYVQSGNLANAGKGLDFEKIFGGVKLLEFHRACTRRERTNDLPASIEYICRLRLGRPSCCESSAATGLEGWQGAGRLPGAFERDETVLAYEDRGFLRLLYVS